MNKSSIFYRTTKLLEGANYSDIKEHPTFLHLKGNWPQPWYNFIVPTVKADQFSWNKAAKILKKEKEEGVTVALYIQENYLSKYRSHLKNKGYKELGDEVYIATSFKRPFKEDFSDLIFANQSNLEEYISIANKCFPDWENNAKFTRYFYDLSLRKSSSDKLYKNILLKHKGKFVSFGSVIVSKPQRLSYLHNMGTLEEYRRKGFFSKVTRYLCNFSLKSGVNEICALVEDRSASFLGLSKLGFTPKNKYYLFILSD